MRLELRSVQFLSAALLDGYAFRFLPIPSFPLLSLWQNFAARNAAHRYRRALIPVFTWFMVTVNAFY